MSTPISGPHRIKPETLRRVLADVAAILKGELGWVPEPVVEMLRRNLKIAYEPERDGGARERFMLSDDWWAFYGKLEDVVWYAFEDWNRAERKQRFGWHVIEDEKWAQLQQQRSKKLAALLGETF